MAKYMQTANATYDEYSKVTGSSHKESLDMIVKRRSQIQAALKQFYADQGCHGSEAKTAQDYMDRLIKSN